MLYVLGHAESVPLDFFTTRYENFQQTTFVFGWPPGGGLGLPVNGDVPLR